MVKEKGGFQKGNKLWQKGLKKRMLLHTQANEALSILHAGLFEDYLEVHQKVILSKKKDYELTKRDKIILQLVRNIEPYIFAKRQPIKSDGTDADTTININIVRDYKE